MANKSKTPVKRATEQKQTGNRTGKRPQKEREIKRQPVRLEEKLAKKQRSYISSGVIVLIVAVILGIFTYSSSQESIGIGGAYIHNCLFGLFAKAAYLLPAALFCLGMCLKLKGQIS